MDVSQVSTGEIASSPPIKKTRTRKKVEAVPPEAAEPASVIQAESGETPSVTPPKRSRKKKTADEAGSPKDQEVRTPSESAGPVPQAPTDSPADALPTKPKRTRRVGEPKPKRYPVGEQEAEQGV